MKKKNFLSFAGILFLAITFCFAACGNGGGDDGDQDENAVQTAKEALTLGDLSSVTANLTLPGDSDGVTIEWESSNTTWLSHAGVVTRPPYTHATATVSVNLTATLTKGNATDTKVFPVTIPRMAMTDAQAVETAKAAIIAALGDLTQVIANLTLPTTHTGVTIGWVSNTPAVLSNAGVVTRPTFEAGNATVTLTANFSLNSATDQHVFTVTVIRLPSQDELMEHVLKKIRMAEVSLGDLSTVGGNITLPASDAEVLVSWVSSNTTVVSNAGVVTRPSGTPTTLTLTGTFTCAADATLTRNQVWNVRVLHTEAGWRDFLNVHYMVDTDGVFKDMAPSGDFYSPTLMSGATTDRSARTQAQLPQFNDGRYVNLGANGFVDLGPKVGSILRLPEWTIEFYVRVPATSVGTWLSFGNDENINTVTADSWRGTFNFTSGGMWLRALDNGAVGHNQGRGGDGGNQNAVGHAVVVGDSAGIAHRVDYWLHVSLVRLPNGQIRILRNWNQAMNGPLNTGFGRLATAAIYGSGNPELEDLRFGYLGRSVLLNSTAGGDANSGYPANSFIYDFKVYSRASLPANAGAGTNHPEGDGLWDGESANLNTAFGFTRAGGR